MCDEEQSSTPVETDETDSQLSLLDLPVEIFFHICSFLDASTLVHGLSLVCKQFHQILNDNLQWRMRTRQIWPDTCYPVLPPADDDELFWKLSCVALEKQISLWGKKDSMVKLSLDKVQYSTIDGLLLMQDGNICISGARDRSLVCWKLSAERNELDSYKSIEFAHDGWIWDLAPMDNMIYSCSWDQTVKSWTLTNTGLVHFKTYEMYMKPQLVIFSTLVMGSVKQCLLEREGDQPRKLLSLALPHVTARNITSFLVNIEVMSNIFFRSVTGSALLCVACCPKLALFATGSFCRTIFVYDHRVNYKPVVHYRPHKRAVIRLVMNSNFILSASEDRTVSVWDQRAGRIMENITISQESFPLSMSMQQDIVYVGDGSAKLHVLDPKANFKPVKCFSTEHKKGINGIHATPGCLITSSRDATIQISSPTDPPQRLTTLNSCYGEIASTDYLNDVLAISGADGLEIWRPRSSIQCA